ncbi:UNVERIFIED_CONTAM: hypothetical protein Scaly_3043500 [Sesamum calycinum]|uniref:DUF4283 domain-containing protein n=1 Tax=Sesamum calycinum TaxID=2727403 RepID=A0AAW2K8E4_9LAMI
MLPKSNSLCPLSHNTHTDSTHTTHTESTAVHDEDPDGDNNAPEAEILGGDSLGLAGKESPCTREEFDFDGFYELANRVLNGDSEAMANLNSLKERWEQKFKTSKNQLSSTDPVPLTDLAYPVVRPGIDSHGSSSSSHLGLATSPQGQEPQESLLPPISDVPAQLLEDLSQDSRKEGPVWGRSDRTVETTNSKPALLSGLDSTMSAQDGLLTHSNIYIERRNHHPANKGGGRQWLQKVAVNGGRVLSGRLDMEDVIEGGPWLFQGQPIVLQPWEQGMSLRRQKHTQIPVWIRLRHLPMEYWTDEGLSTVASGVGTPLYTDGITKDCSRLDFARVCVMLDFNSALPKHLVVISPVLRNGKEDPKRIDVEYEWLPQRCKSCCSLGHVSATCPANVKKNVARR